MEFESKIQELENEIFLLKKRLHRNERAFRKFKRSLQPEKEKKPRKPSGFARPTLLSDKLCEFLNLPIGSLLPRTEVTKRILQYVKDENLQNPSAKKFILLNEKMKDLLEPDPDFNVTYFNIQKLLKKHYTKIEK